MPKRLFVAIDLPDSARQLLAELDPHIRGVRWVDPDQMHLTLGFFDDVPDDVDSALREKLSAIDFGAFFLPVRGVGTFSTKGAPKIIWIGVGKRTRICFKSTNACRRPRLLPGWSRSCAPGIRTSLLRAAAMSGRDRSEIS